MNTKSDAAQANTGHGHVYPRPDGAKARCGGPGLCAECSREAARKVSGEKTTDTTPTPVTVERLRELVDSYANATDVCDLDYVTDLGAAIDELIASRETAASVQQRCAHCGQPDSECDGYNCTQEAAEAASRSPAVDTYQHKLHCNAGGRTPLGGDMCICLIPESPAVDTAGLVERCARIAENYGAYTGAGYCDARSPDYKPEMVHEYGRVFSEAKHAIARAIRENNSGTWLEPAAPSSCTGEGR